MNPTLLKRHKHLSETYLCDVTMQRDDVTKCEYLDDAVEDANLQKTEHENLTITIKSAVYSVLYCNTKGLDQLSIENEFTGNI